MAMFYKYILPVIALLVLSNDIDAQKVKRKGTTPLMKKSKRDMMVASFTTEQLKGKWQESARSYRDGNLPADLKDTIYLTFSDNKKVETREGNKPNLKGEYFIDVDNTLTAAGDVYAIKSVGNNEMVLDDNDEYVHTFTKKDNFWFDNVGKDSVTFESYSSVIEIKIADVLGSWMVYKKTASPGAVKPDAPIIRYLKITDKQNETAAKGKITFSKDEQAQELPCNITIYKTGIQVTADKYNWYLPVYKADGKELVFGNVELMLYYCKPIN